MASKIFLLAQNEYTVFLRKLLRYIMSTGVNQYELQLILYW